MQRREVVQKNLTICAAKVAANNRLAVVGQLEIEPKARRSNFPGKQVAQPGDGSVDQVQLTIGGAQVLTGGLHSIPSRADADREPLRKRQLILGPESDGGKFRPLHPWISVKRLRRNTVGILILDAARPRIFVVCVCEFSLHTTAKLLAHTSRIDVVTQLHRL